jgi:RNA polymerase sigma-70 factor, ECF subfamily
MTDDRLSQLYRTYGSVIYDRCRSMLEDAAEAEDATHETFLRLQRHLHHLPGPQEVVFWIYRVATNYCLNEIRNRKRRAAPSAILPEPAAALDSDPERPIADRQLARQLIDRAPAKVRAVAWLYHLDGLEQQEVARVLGLSRRTVTTRLADFARGARKYLRSNGL